VVMIVVPSVLFLACFAGLLVARFILGLGIGWGLPRVGRVDERVLQPERSAGWWAGVLDAALGLIIGPLVALSLISSGSSHGTTWRLLLGSGPCLPPASCGCGR